MTTERWSPQPYATEELLSFDRIKRAVIGRVVDRAEGLMEEEFPLSPERTSSLISEEWQRVKEAVRSSPLAREAFRKHLESTITGEIDNLVTSDRDELKSLGVVEKSL